MSTAPQRQNDLAAAAAIAERVPPAASGVRPERTAGQLPAVILRLPDVSPATTSLRSAPKEAPLAALVWLRANAQFAAFMVFGVAIIAWLMWGNRAKPSVPDDRPSAPAWNPPTDGPSLEAPAAGPEFPRHTPVPAWKTPSAAPEDTSSHAPSWSPTQPDRPLATPADATRSALDAPPGEIRTARAGRPDPSAAPRYDGSAYDRPPTARLQNVIVKPNSADDGRARP